MTVTEVAVAIDEDAYWHDPYLYQSFNQPTLQYLPHWVSDDHRWESTIFCAMSGDIQRVRGDLVGRGGRDTLSFLQFK